MFEENEACEFTPPPPRWQPCRWLKVVAYPHGPFGNLASHWKVKYATKWFLLAEVAETDRDSETKKKAPEENVSKRKNRNFRWEVKLVFGELSRGDEVRGHEPPDGWRRRSVWPDGQIILFKIWPFI